MGRKEEHAKSLKKPAHGKGRKKPESSHEISEKTDSETEIPCKTEKVNVVKAYLLFSLSFR
jgi:hypothetical protein